MSKNNNDTAVDIDTVDDITNSISKVDISDGDVPEICANCGKEGASNSCNKCKMTKYCNAACKKKHRKKHKKDCEEHLRRAAELHLEDARRVADLHDEKLFKQPPPTEDDCPICFLRLPLLGSGKKYRSCCGKVICSGCIHASVYDDKGNALDNKICPFCRGTPAITDEEIIKRLRKRVEVNDTNAMSILADYYSNGTYVLPQDHAKAFELWERAVELGSTAPLFDIGMAYRNGCGVDIDVKKAIHYMQLAAVEGDMVARNNIGALDESLGNIDKAIKHYMMSIRGGYNGSLKWIKQLYLDGQATKHVYTEALLAYQKYLGEIRSPQRDEAAAFDDKYKYIE